MRDLFSRDLVGAVGFEPTTSWSRTRRSSQAEPRPERSSKDGEVYISEQNDLSAFSLRGEQASDDVEVRG